MQRKQRRKASKNQTKVTPAANPAVYEVRMSEAAEQAYAAYFDRAQAAIDRGDLTSSHVTALNMIDDVIENVIPRDPFSRRYALVGKLSNFFRMQKGRMRICWMGSSSRKIVYIVFISETLRKSGDINDPYRLFTNMFLSGEFDAI